MAIGRHLVIETMEAAARMGKSVLTERIIYPVSFSTLNPPPTVMSTSFAKKISKKLSIFPGAQFQHLARRRWHLKLSCHQGDVPGLLVAPSRRGSDDGAEWRRRGSYQNGLRQPTFARNASKMGPNRQCRVDSSRWRKRRSLLGARSAGPSHRQPGERLFWMAHTLRHGAAGLGSTARRARA
jgi:hypothetical protein